MFKSLNSNKYSMMMTSLKEFRSTPEHHDLTIVEGFDLLPPGAFVLDYVKDMLRIEGGDIEIGQFYPQDF